MTLVYPVIIIPTGENDYYVKIPDMYIGTQGNSIKNAIEMARDAICLMAVDLPEDKKPIPDASEISDIKSDEKGAIVTLVDADVTAYKRMSDMRLNYPICLYPNDDGTYTVVVPDLDGCVTEGRDFSDALNMAVDAACGWVLDELEEGRKPPKPSNPSKIKADEYENGIVSVIMLDMGDYASKHGKKSG